MNDRAVTIKDLVRIISNMDDSDMQDFWDAMPEKQAKRFRKIKPRTDDAIRMGDRPCSYTKYYPILSE